MRTIQATYRVVTPMFLGGADPEKAEFRLPSFKGVLRFWWRALAWGRVIDELGNGSRALPQQDQILRRIKKQEDWLFGSTEAQAKFLLHAETDKPQRVRKGEVLQNEDGMEMVGPGARYLGYGVMGAFGSKAGKLSRGCIRAPFDFTVHALPKPKANKESRDLFGVDLTPTLRRALKATGLFGGMGSKARKGYGSMVLLRLDGEQIDASPQALANEMKLLIRPTAHADDRDATPYTAFSPASRIYVAHDARATSPLKMLDRLGREMVRERSWGFKGQLFNFSEKAERNYKDDHDLMKRAKRGKKVRTHPERAVFGLPHNYGKSYTQQVEPADSDHNRRASPLFLKIHRFEDAGVGFVVTFLPADFLPTNEKLRVGKNRSVPLKEEGFWEPIKRYITRITDTGSRSMSLTECCEITPQQPLIPPS